MKSVRWSRGCAVILGSVAILSAGPRAQMAHADNGAPSASVAPADSASSVGRGLAVMAGAGAQESAWDLARDVYGDPSLRPAFDEAHARVLAGEDAPADAAADLRDLAETRAAIHGDDPASKRLLASVATQLHVRGIVYVEQGPAPERPHARVFVTSTASFDAATYAANVTGANHAGASAASNDAWADTVRLLGRSYGTTPATPVVAAPAAASGSSASIAADATNATNATGSTRKDTPPSHPFYTSPWFWGAVGAAVFGGVAIYFATRDSDSGTIHLQLQVPR